MPDVGPLLAQLIERERHADTLRHTIAQARHHGKWDEALRAVENAPQEERDKPGLQQTRFEILALGKLDREQAVTCGNGLIERFAEDAHRLNEFAWELLTNEEYGGRFNDLALAAAERACQASDYRDWMILDTLALARFHPTIHLIHHLLLRQVLHLLDQVLDGLPMVVGQILPLKDDGSWISDGFDLDDVQVARAW